jgi:hypothetical protein
MNTKASFRKNRLSLALLGAMGLVATSMSAYAQETAIAGVVFTTKFVCGQTGDATFETNVNLHNPHEEELCLNKYMVVANPQREPRGPISPRVLERFGPNEAIGVNCDNIRDAFAAPPDFIEGFVVLELIPDPLVAAHPPGLAVQAVYNVTDARRNNDMVVNNNFVGEGGGLDVDFPLTTPTTFPCPVPLP